MEQMVTRTTIVRYLLGQLPDEERRELTDRYFEDDDLFADILAVKDELLDDYRRGALTPADKIAFEEFLRKYPSAEHELELARALDDYAHQHPEQADATTPAWNPIRVVSRLLSQPLYRPVIYTLSSIVLVAIAGMWVLAVKNRHLNELLTSSKDEVIAARDLRAELERERKEKAALEERLRIPLTAATDTQTIAFSLAVARDSVEARRLIISPQKIKFEVSVEVEKSFRKYEALIQIRGDVNAIWPRHAVPARRSGNYVTLSIEVPVDRFKIDTVYKLTAIGVEDNQNSEELGSEYFTVIKR